jgi:hypothetical protein
VERGEVKELKESKLDKTVGPEGMTSCCKIDEATTYTHLEECYSDRAIDTNLRNERAGDRILRVHA